MIGTRVGAYAIMRELGVGGMGTVYEALHVQLGRKVALKVLKREVASSPEMLTRFFNEARAVNHVDHPGLVQISDFGSLTDGSPYLVMELLRGETLAARLAARGRLTESEVLTIVGQLASILAAAHEKGIVHRDVKPSNVMLVPDPAVTSGERVKLLDFGVAKIANSAIANGVPMTQKGLPIGTPLYMSPEQCVGATDIDGKADVYALGVILFELLAGHCPFEAENALALLNMHVRKPPPSLRELVPTVTPTTVQLLDALLSKESRARLSAAQVQAACLPPSFPGQTASRPAAVSGRQIIRRAVMGGLVAGVLALICGLLLRTCSWLLPREMEGGAKPVPTPSPVTKTEKQETLDRDLGTGSDRTLLRGTSLAAPNNQVKHGPSASPSPATSSKPHTGDNRSRSAVSPITAPKNKKPTNGKTTFVIP